VREPRFQPVYGALFRAYQAMGVEVSDEVLENLEGRA
jgi:hypothetical protein